MFRFKEIYQIIGYKIKEYRSRLGITQQKLAEDINLERITIVNMEKGNQKIPLDLLYIIADYFSLSISSLLPLDDEIKHLINKIKVNKIKNDDNKKFDSLSEKDLSEEEKNIILKDILNK